MAEQNIGLNARVYGKAHIFDDEFITENARVVWTGTSLHGAICGRQCPYIYAHAVVSGNAHICGSAVISGDGWVGGSDRVGCDDSEPDGGELPEENVISKDVN